MIYLVISEKKKIFPFRVWPIITPFLSKLDTEKQFLRGFTNFFHNNWIATQVININESPNIFHWKSTKKNKVDEVCGAKFGSNLVQCCEKTKKNWYFNGLFLIFCMRYTFTSTK